MSNRLRMKDHNESKKPQIPPLEEISSPLIFASGAKAGIFDLSLSLKAFGCFSCHRAQSLLFPFSGGTTEDSDWADGLLDFADCMASLVNLNVSSSASMNSKHIYITT